MRVGVLFRRSPVRGPPRMTHAVDAIDWFRADHVFEVGELPGRSPQLDPLGTDDRNASGVVAAVLHAAEAVDQDGYDWFRSDVTDNPAHTVASPVGAAARAPAYFFLRSTQPSLFVCRPGAMPSDPAGTSSVMDEPAPTYAPLPTVTGAMSCVSLPIKAPSSMTVWCLFT